jgi:hypothetical protein
VFNLLGMDLRGFHIFQHREVGSQEAPGLGFNSALCGKVFQVSPE